MDNKVLIIGSLNYDMIFKIDHVPLLGENITADSVTFCGGGKGANQAVQCAKLGLDTYMAGCVGDDAAGVFLVENLKNNQINTDYINVVEGASGMAAVNSLYDGSVFATLFKGANYKVSKKDIDALVPLLQECSFVIFQLEIPIPVVEYAVKLAKAKGCAVILNSAPASEISEECIRSTDVFIANEVEAAFYVGELIQSVEKAKNEVEKMAKKYQNKCIFTLGKHGTVVSNGSNTEFVPPIDVKVVETTGAGDSFVGGIAHALITGKDIFQAAQWATYCSAITIGGTGAQPSMPDLRQVEELLKIW